MNPEIEIIKAAAPALLNLIAMIAVIAYTKKALFHDMVSKEHLQSQIDINRDFVGATKEASAHLEEIGRQLENLSKKVSEDIKEMGDRVHTLELVFSDNIDAIRELSSNCEKHRKNIPDTEVFLQQRKAKPA
jgi:hypothetical protein